MIEFTVLSRVDLECADLTHANLIDSDLTGAIR